MDSKSNSLDVSFAATLSKLIEDNEKLKRRVDVLEETFNDKLASLEQENDTLQKHLSAMISLTECELQKERSETKTEPRRSGNRAGIQYSNEDRLSQHKTPQYCNRFRSSNDKLPNSPEDRDTNGSIHDGHLSSNRYRARDDRRSSSCTKSVNDHSHGGHSSSYMKSVNSHSHDGHSSSNRYRARDDRRSSSYTKSGNNRSQEGNSSSYTKSVNSHSHDGHSSSNRYRARDDRRSSSYTKSGNNRSQERNLSSYTKSVNSHTHEGRTSSSRYDSRDDRHSRKIHDKGKYFHESHSRDSSDKRKRPHSPRGERNDLAAVDLPSSQEITPWNERRNEPPVVCLPSSQKITLWSTTGETHIKKIYSTPMKFISFPDYKLISPLPNTPDQLKEKFKELGNKISPVPLLMGENRIIDKNESIKHSERKNIEMKSVEVRTIVKTDDVEHGVFKRKRKT